VEQRVGAGWVMVEHLIHHETTIIDSSSPVRFRITAPPGPGEGSTFSVVASADSMGIPEASPAGSAELPSAALQDLAKGARHMQECERPLWSNHGLCYMCMWPGQYTLLPCAWFALGTCLGMRVHSPHR
jgi:hypothetical protein